MSAKSGALAKERIALKDVAELKEELEKTTTAYEELTGWVARA